MVFASISFSSLDIADFSESAFNDSFRESFKLQMAAAAGVSTEKVVIHSISSGSVTVDSTAAVPGDSADPSGGAAGYVEQVSSDPQSIFTTQEFSTYGAVNSSNVSVVVVTVSPTTHSPTATTSPMSTAPTTASPLTSYPTTSPSTKTNSPTITRAPFQYNDEGGSTSFFNHDVLMAMVSIACITFIGFLGVVIKYIFWPIQGVAPSDTRELKIKEGSLWDKTVTGISSTMNPLMSSRSSNPYDEEDDIFLYTQDRL
ncbi:hypothetical protein CYMTET_31486 [Cymbomonas tetramitiformis]|uniref:Uncharacterized protein n=1 Tax=Cymbomonas tetramitiformis TaxID=36881 RepID=A0AAE0KT66_9CHLO|nr:hypothetical protein CYMTET_31486 [Cymbomonas tetramitiformis]